MKSLDHIKDNFPFFAANPEKVYLDSGATAQKPQRIIDGVTSLYTAKNANAGRGVYPLSTSLAQEIEEVRSQVQHFIHANDPGEVFFTSGATNSQEKIAQSFLTYLKHGDEILYSPFDHTSFVSPWFGVQKILKRFGVEIHLIPYDVKETGEANIDDIVDKVTKNTRIINITHIHNVFGAVTKIHRLKEVKKGGIIINVDAAQSVGHIEVDVEELGADILSFSGHKMFASLGTGILYIRGELHKKLNEFIPRELGTKDYGGILSLGEAIAYIEHIGINEIHMYLADLTQYAIEALKTIPEIKFTKGLAHCSHVDGCGTVSFTIDGIDPADVAFYLAKNDIMVRAGEHCAMTPGDEVNAVRVSMHIYNSREDIDLLIEKLRQLI